jgi:putative polyhydroxyalkanoate system protein
MAVIRITRSHHLSRGDLRVEIERLADEIREKLHARCHWDGDVAHFVRRGASGSITLDDARIAIEITLSLPLSPLKSQVEKTVNDRLDQLLT